MDRKAFPFELDAALLARFRAHLPEGEDVEARIEALLARVIETGRNVERAAEKDRVARAVARAFRDS